MLATIKRQNSFFPVFSDFFGENFLNNNDWATTPSINIAENKDGFRIEVAVPGLNKEDIKINIDKNILEISFERKVNVESNSSKECDDKYYRKDFCYSNFKRSFTLPEYTDKDHISANHKNGVLNVYIPKKEETKEKPARIISIE